MDHPLLCAILFISSLILRICLSSKTGSEHLWQLGQTITPRRSNAPLLLTICKALNNSTASSLGVLLPHLPFLWQIRTPHVIVRHSSTSFASSRVRRVPVNHPLSCRLRIFLSHIASGSVTIIVASATPRTLLSTDGLQLDKTCTGEETLCSPGL